MSISVAFRKAVTAAMTVSPRNRTQARQDILVGCQAVSRTTCLWVAYLALAALLAAPLLLVEVPLGMDTLNHLARVHVRAHLADDRDLARLFEVRDVLVPYMGLDWLLTPLARVMPTLVVGRIAIVLLLWGMIGALVVLQRAVAGRVGFEPLLMGLVSYNALIGWGFLNYVLGVICALLGLAAWHATRGRTWLLRLPLFAVVATALYFVHLLALALYGFLLCAYEAFGRPRAMSNPLRDWGVLAAQFVPAGLLWLQLAMPPPGGETGIFWHPASKALALMSPLLFAGAAGENDFGMIVFAGGVFLLFRLTRIGVLRWDRRLAAPAVALLLLSMILPTRAFGVSFLDLRLPAVAAGLAFAAIRVAPSGPGRRLLLPGLLAAATLVQVASAGSTMRACDRQYGELRAALQAVPRGAVLIATQEKSPVPGVPCGSPRFYDHMPQLVTLERSGYSPDFFARVTAVTVRGGLPSDRDPWPAHLVTSDMLPPGGYLLWMHLGNRTRPLPGGVRLLHNGSFFDLFFINGSGDRG